MIRRAVGVFLFFTVLIVPLSAFASTIDNQSWLTTKSSSIDPTALPLGNGKFSATTPAPGILFACDPTHTYTLTQTGAQAFGDWVHGSTWSLTQRLGEGAYVHGSVSWPNASFSAVASGTVRIISTNDLPLNEPTGIFPIAASDPAYHYDHNPNAIVPQAYSISVPTTPTASIPSCVPHGPVAIGLDGSVFFSSIDSNGRDEPSYELQDACGGMSAPSGIYHRYLPSTCMPHMTERNALVGYALDGFGVFSPYDADGKELTTRDLDECHGTTTPIVWDGKVVTMYHYVLTRDFPYNISCFRGTPKYIKMPPPPPRNPFMPITDFLTHWWALLVLLVAVAVYLFVKRK